MNTPALLAYLRDWLDHYPEDVFGPLPPVTPETTPADRTLRTLAAVAMARHVLGRMIADVEEQHPRLFGEDRDAGTTPSPEPGDSLHLRMCQWLRARAADGLTGLYSKSSMVATVCPDWMSPYEARAACEATAERFGGWPCGACFGSGDAPFPHGTCLVCEDHPGREPAEATADDSPCDARWSEALRLIAHDSTWTGERWDTPAGFTRPAALPGMLREFLADIDEAPSEAPSDAPPEHDPSNRACALNGFTGDALVLCSCEVDAPDQACAVHNPVETLTHSLPTDWGPFADDSEDAACCTYGITSDYGSVWFDEEGLSVARNDNVQATASLNAVLHVLDHVGKLSTHVEDAGRVYAKSLGQSAPREHAAESMLTAVCETLGCTPEDDPVARIEASVAQGEAFEEQLDSLASTAYTVLEQMKPLRNANTYANTQTLIIWCALLRDALKTADAAESKHVLIVPDVSKYVDAASTIRRFIERGYDDEPALAAIDVLLEGCARSPDTLNAPLESKTRAPDQDTGSETRTILDELDSEEAE